MHGWKVLCPLISRVSELLKHGDSLTGSTWQVLLRDKSRDRDMSQWLKVPSGQLVGFAYGLGQNGPRAFTPKPYTKSPPFPEVVSKITITLPRCRCPISNFTEQETEKTWRGPTTNQWQSWDWNLSLSALHIFVISQGFCIFGGRPNVSITELRCGSTMAAEWT